MFVCMFTILGKLTKVAGRSIVLAGEYPFGVSEILQFRSFEYINFASLNKRMRLHTPEISWHGKEPVFSVDFSKVGSIWRLASAGADNDIKLWSVNCETEGKPSIEFCASLNRHTKAVNVVRFSPNEDILASGSDDNFVIIWKPSVVQDETAGNMLKDASEVENKENWTAAKMLRGHIEDVYDLAWSPDGTQLISGSVDNSAIIWDVIKGQKLAMFKDHKHYVQGVTWDPLGQYLATLSTDRSCRLYNCGSHRCCYNINKLSYPGNKTGDTGEILVKSSRMFHDETLTTFFRRLSYTPDGSLLIVPAGQMDINDQNVNTSYIFTRSCPNKPAVCLPSPQKATVAIRCCPLLFQLQSDSDVDKENADLEKSLFKLPYRMVFAVATLDSVLLYDTQQRTPFGYVGNIHYAALTDISWSSNGRSLIVSSSDGYCSLVHFAEGELGKLYHLSVKELLEKPPSSAIKNLSQTPQGTTDPGVKNTKRASPVESEKNGTPGAKKKDPKGISLYTVPIATSNTPVCKGGQPTPRRVQLARLTPPGEETISSDQSNNTPVTPPSTITAAPRRVQLTTLVSDGETPTLSPHQNSQTLAADTRQDSKTNKSDVRSPPDVQKPIKPRRVQLTSIPCETVPQIAVRACEDNSSPPTPSHQNSQQWPTSQTSKPSTVLAKASAPKPRRVSTTLVLESRHEEKKAAKANSDADSSSKTCDTANVKSKAPRRVQLTKVVEIDPTSQETVPKPARKVVEAFENRTSQSNQRIEVSSKASQNDELVQQDLVTKEAAAEKKSESTDLQSNQGVEDAGAPQGNSTKSVGLCGSCDNLSNSQAENSTACHSANNVSSVSKNQLNAPETSPFTTPQLSQEKTELIRVCRTALDAVSNAVEGANIHDIPAVQNVYNVERELVMRRERGGHVQTADQAAQGEVQRPQDAQHLVRGKAQLTQAAQLTQGKVQRPQDAQHPTPGTAQQTQDGQQLAKEEVQRPQDAQHLAHGKVQQTQVTHQCAQGKVQQPQDAQHLAHGKVQQTQVTHQCAQGKVQQPQDAQHLAHGKVQQTQAAQLAQGAVQQQPSERELESDKQLNQSQTPMPYNPTSSNATPHYQAKSRELPSSAVMSRDCDKSTPMPRPGRKRVYPLEPEVIIINDGD